MINQKWYEHKRRYILLYRNVLTIKLNLILTHIVLKYLPLSTIFMAVGSDTFFNVFFRIHLIGYEKWPNQKYCDRYFLI